MKSALIIGGGFAGCAAAHQLALQGNWRVTLIEAGPELGAGVRTKWLGGHPYTFGPRHFLTQNQKVFEFLDNYVPLRRCQEHEFLTYVERDATFYSYPIHEGDIWRMPQRDQIKKELSERCMDSIANAQNLEEFWSRSIGPALYNKFIDAYSRKMWGVESNIYIDDFAWSPKGVTLKQGPRQAWNTAISAYPKARNGYDDYFALATQEARVLLNTKALYYSFKKKGAYFDNDWHDFDVIISTISPDLLHQQCFGPLPYMGRELQTLILPCEFALPPHVYFTYYAGAERHTRVTEYKKFTQHYDPTSTLITIETPVNNGARLYPMPFKSEQARAQRYLDLMPDGVFSIGRAGSYRYSIDIDDCIEQAMGVAGALK